MRCPKCGESSLAQSGPCECGYEAPKSALGFAPAWVWLFLPASLAPVGLIMTSEGVGRGLAVVSVHVVGLTLMYCLGVAGTCLMIAKSHERSSKDRIMNCTVVVLGSWLLFAVAALVGRYLGSALR